jgi:1-aminocyclopropane-1-carboxylate deaminase/D-cysteine desulfhydrase-like pyridoxal-dependent ACC family enzyme
MKIKCYSVRLKELRSISSKALLAIAHDGSSDVIPKSQVYGPDYDVRKSEAYWISAWIMKYIGMDADELLRLKQLSGIVELFKDKEFTKSWEK